MKSRTNKEKIDANFLESLEDLWEAVAELIDDDDDRPGEEVSQFWKEALRNRCVTCFGAKAAVYQFRRESRYKYNVKGEVVSFG